MLLRHHSGPLASPPKHPKRKFSDFLERRGLAARAAGASFPRCAQSGDLPPRRVNAIARFRFGHNPLQPNIQTMFYALKHVQWIKLLRTKIKTHRQVHSRIPVGMIRSRLHVAFQKYRRQIQGKDGLGKCDRLALAPDRVEYSSGITTLTDSGRKSRFCVNATDRHLPQTENAPSWQFFNTPSSPRPPNNYLHNFRMFHQFSCRLPKTRREPREQSLAIPAFRRL